MSSNSQLILPQSTTTVASTPPPSSSHINGKTTTTTVSHHDQSTMNQRLQLYNNLFGQEKNNVSDETGLQSTQSLNYSLNTFLHLNDLNWILAVIDIDEFDNIKETLGDYNANRKINQIGTVVHNFCNSDPRRLKDIDSNLKIIMILKIIYLQF